MGLVVLVMVKLLTALIILRRLSFAMIHLINYTSSIRALLPLQFPHLLLLRITHHNLFPTRARNAFSSLLRWRNIIILRRNTLEILIICIVWRQRSLGIHIILIVDLRA